MSRLFSVRELCEITGKGDKTVKTKLEGLPSSPGPKGAKLYDSKKALALLYTDVGDLSTERARLTVLQAEKTQLEIDKMRGELIPVPDLLRLVGREYTAVRARMLSQPSALAKLLALESDPAKVKATLEEWVVDALTELTTDETYKKNSPAAKTGDAQWSDLPTES